jgi:MoxR-like ATPase
VQRCVRHGASPRATQALLKAGRARALLRGRAHLSAEDLHAVALPVLRHRIFRALAAELDGVTADALVAAALASVPA